MQRDKEAVLDLWSSGLTSADIASVTDMRPEYVRTIVQRARDIGDSRAKVRMLSRIKVRKYGAFDVIQVMLADSQCSMIESFRIKRDAFKCAMDVFNIDGACRIVVDGDRCVGGVGGGSKSNEEWRRIEGVALAYRLWQSPLESK